jgi:hypothetical protein
MFRHPKYYKELRSRNKADTIKRRVMPGRPILDQAISLRAHDGECERATGPGLKPQATSFKLQAAGVKLSNQPVQASSDKRQAPGSKLQASSHKRQAQ